MFQNYVKVQLVNLTICIFFKDVRQLIADDTKLLRFYLNKYALYQRKYKVYLQAFIVDAHLTRINVKFTLDV